MKSTIHFFRDLKFKKKLFISYIIISMIPILVLGAYSYREAKISIIDKSTEGLNNAINRVAHNMNHDLIFYNNITNFIAYNNKMQQIFSSNYIDLRLLANDLREFLNPFLNNVLDMHDEIKRITIYTKTDMPEYGEYIQDYSKIQDEEWTKTLKDVKKPKWHYRQGKLFLAKKLIDFYSDRELGIIYVEFDYDKLVKNTVEIDIKQYGLLIVDDKGNIIYDFNNLKEQYIINDTAILINDRKNISYYNSTQYLFVESISQIENWRFICYIPTAELTGGTCKILSTTILIASICFLVLMGIIWLFSRTIVKPIDNLNKNMKLVEQGQINIRVHSESKDEIGQLTNRFDDMVRRINELIETVYQKEITEKAAELKALQAQINPHFLYNTLSVMNWKAMDVEAEELSKMITLLSKFYRTALNKGEMMTTVKNELDNTKAYIEIQRIVHDNSFDVIYDIDDSIYEYDILNLLLQPIVENALEHGLFKKKLGDKIIEVSARQGNSDIIIEIKDNGIGIDDSILPEILLNESNGYGLKNVNERIKLFFGEDYELVIDSEKNIGTTIILRIPKYCH